MKKLILIFIFILFTSVSSEGSSSLMLSMAKLKALAELPFPQSNPQEFETEFQKELVTAKAEASLSSPPCSSEANKCVRAYEDFFLFWQALRTEIDVARRKISLDEAERRLDWLKSNVPENGTVGDVYKQKVEKGALSFKSALNVCK